MKRSERIYRWLLRLYPRDFRDEYGHEMSLLFRARAHDGSLRLWFQVLGDLVFHAPHEHWSTMKQELRYAVRQLRRSPGFSAVVIATLALGIGGTTAVFSVLQAVLLAPLPYEQPGQLVRFYQQEPDKPATRALPDGCALLVASRTTRRRSKPSRRSPTTPKPGVTSSADGRAQRLRVLRVTSDYFHTLRSGPLRGPGFDRRDEVGHAGARGAERSGCGARALAAILRSSAPPFN